VTWNRRSWRGKGEGAEPHPSVRAAGIVRNLGLGRVRARRRGLLRSEYLGARKMAGAGRGGGAR
jgi:hypothetical protein